VILRLIVVCEKSSGNIWGWEGGLLWFQDDVFIKVNLVLGISVDLGWFCVWWLEWVWVPI